MLLHHSHITRVSNEVHASTEIYVSADAHTAVISAAIRLRCQQQQPPET